MKSEPPGFSCRVSGIIWRGLFAAGLGFLALAVAGLFLVFRGWPLGFPRLLPGFRLRPAGFLAEFGAKPDGPNRALQATAPPLGLSGFVLCSAAVFLSSFVRGASPELGR